MRQTRRRRQQWRLFIVTVILVACALVATHYGIALAGRIAARRQPVLQPQPETVAAGTKLIWATSFSVCGDEEREETAPDQATIGQSREQLQAANSGWTVESFAGGQVVLRRTERLCSLHRDNRTLKIVGDAVVVFYGTPDRLGPKIDVVPDLAPASLTIEDRASLEQGVVFNSDDPAVLADSIQSYLEGINE